jgi:LEA14-like dessication related protein
MMLDAMRTPRGRVRAAVLLLATLLLAACASMPARDPLQVTVAGIEPLTGEGMEIRLLVKLRVQNPNDTPVEFDGAALNLDVMGRRFASGVSDEAGIVPRFGEAIVAVPVTVSVLRMARQFMGMLDGKPVERIDYSMSGKLHGAGMSGTQRFSAQGDFELPRSAPVAAGTT